MGARFRGAVVGLVLVGTLAASGASASAAPYTFQVLSATSTYTVDAERDCVSGHRRFTQSLSGVVPDDPQNSYTPGEGGFGSISTRSSITDTSPTTGQFSEDYIDNECSTPPCHYDYGVTPVNGASIYMELSDIGDPETLKVSTDFLPPGVGDVTNGICGGPIDARFPFGEPSSTVSADALFSGKPVELIVSGIRQFSADNLGRPASITVDYDVRMTVQASGGSLQADPGGPYTVKRAGKVKLDGSASKPKQKIKDYIWKFRPVGADCPQGTPAKSTKKEGRKTDIVALCGVEAILTVVGKNNRDRATASTVVNVVPRGPKGWRTPFKHREKQGDKPRGAPTATAIGGGDYAFSVDGGLNVSDCAGADSNTQEVLCPLLERGSSWLGTGYELKKVDDPKGPFDGDWYVGSSTIEVKRAAQINPAILPGSDFYQQNLQAGRDIAGFLNAVRQHEGLGNGTPRSGHSLIMKTILATPEGDPRRVAEGLFAPEKDAARKLVDKALHAIDRRLDTESNDPLPDIWTGTLDFYDPYQRQWFSGPITVPGGGG